MVELLGHALPIAAFVGVMMIAVEYGGVFFRSRLQTALATTGRWLLLGTAGLLGIVPELGPHLLFVTLYDQHIAPLSVLVVSSVVQAGHGMLPLLAESHRDFIAVKLVNLVVGLAIGVGLMMLGM